MTHDKPVNWIRFNIYPDGGVARLRIYGSPAKNNADNRKDMFEVSSVMSGAQILAFSDAHYGSLWSLIYPDEAQNMGDGWETRRRREPGSDWLIIKLGERAELSSGVVDTAFFKGNFPASFSLQAIDVSEQPIESLIAQSLYWPQIHPGFALSAHKKHEFNLDQSFTATHIRLNIFPDGGVARFRLFGKAAK